MTKNTMAPKIRLKPTNPPITPPAMAPELDFFDFDWGVLEGAGDAAVDSGASPASCAAPASKKPLVGTARYAHAGTAVSAGMASVNF
jgi:hypothetical protein